MLLIGISVDPGRTAIAGAFLRKTKKKNTILQVVGLFLFLFPLIFSLHRHSISKDQYMHLQYIIQKF